MRCKPLVLLVFALFVAAGAAVAQEPTYMDAATHPGAGQVYTRLLVSQSEYDDAGTETAELASIVKVVYGIRPTLAVLAEGEFSSLSAYDRDETGLLWSTFQIKYRLFKEDLGPLNTWMASAFAGVTVPGNMDRTSDIGALGSALHNKHCRGRIGMPYSGHGKTPASGVSRGDLPRHVTDGWRLVYGAHCAIAGA